MLHRLPSPKRGQVLGLVGTNGIGKSTALKVLAGKLKPNLGRFDVRSPMLQPVPALCSSPPHISNACPSKHGCKCHCSSAGGCTVALRAALSDATVAEPGAASKHCRCWCTAHAHSRMALAQWQLHMKDCTDVCITYQQEPFPFGRSLSKCCNASLSTGDVD